MIRDIDIRRSANERERFRCLKCKRRPPKRMWIVKLKDHFFDGAKTAVSPNVLRNFWRGVWGLASPTGGWP